MQHLELSHKKKPENFNSNNFPNQTNDEQSKHIYIDKTILRRHNTRSATGKKNTVIIQPGKNEIVSITVVI